MRYLTLTGTRYDPYLLTGRMLYPSDDELCLQYVAMHVTRYAEHIQQHPEEGEAVELDIEMTRPLWDAPSRDDIERLAIDVGRRGGNAGSIVARVKYMDDIGDPGASKNKAIGELRAFLSPSDNTYLDGTQPRVGKTTLKGDFRDFESVAHLWAARCHFDQHPYPTRGITGGLQAVFANMSFFLSVAEAYREFGEEWKNPRQEQSEPFYLLNWKLMWKVDRENSPYEIELVKLVHE